MRDVEGFANLREAHLHAGRGFGFLKRDDGGKDVFISRTALFHSGYDGDLQVGTRLSFELRKDDKGRAPRAIHIQILSEAPA